MRAVVPSSFLSIALLVPNVGIAQVYSLPTEPPAISAIDAPWYVNGEPIAYGATLYFQTGPAVFFDRNTMVASGTYRGVPIYTDSTLEPWSIIYVPVGGGFVRPYERLRAGELASTTGSRTPSFPVQGPRDEPPTIATTGLLNPDGTPQITEQGRTPLSNPAYTGLRPATRTMESVPRPTRNEGFWIDFNDNRWYYQGPLVRFDADRFEPFGSYRGFPVYREKNGPNTVIYVTAFRDGPLVPYTRR
jgi:hypothetical protein